MEWLSGVAGALVLALVLSSVPRTLVVPRGLYSALVIRLWWVLRRLLRLTTPHGGYDAIDRAQTWLAPLMLIGMLTGWLAGALLAFGLLLNALSPLSWTTAFREAGSSMFTLGFASGDRLKLSVLDFVAAATGPVLIALQIAYLPTLYSAYSRRELEVTLLPVQGGRARLGPGDPGPAVAGRHRDGAPGAVPGLGAAGLGHGRESLHVPDPADLPLPARAPQLAGRPGRRHGRGGPPARPDPARRPAWCCAPDSPRCATSPARCASPSAPTRTRTPGSG
ncbi:hypothetical protein ABZ915_14410 [Streptomyces sp. NPDC046915]|uniref:hypothetical protein n=1 Tax=Streptomyces sp. NPDC046915 TaxID=3155257 RepID=UPI00340468A1